MSEEWMEGALARSSLGSSAHFVLKVCDIPFGRRCGVFLTVCFLPAELGLQCGAFLAGPFSFFPYLQDFSCLK